MAKKEIDPMDYTIEEMKAKINDFNRELFELRNELALNRKLEKPHLIKQKRKEKARLLTFMTQKLNRSKEAL